MTHEGRIHDRFEEIAKEHPSYIAIREGGRSWTYGEIAAQSAHLAVELQLAAVNRTGPVAIYARRSGRLVVTMLACSRAGLTFSVLDSAYPATRIRSMIATVAPSVLVSIDRVGQPPDPELELDEALPVIDVDEAILCRLPAEPLPQIADRQAHVAYLLFTSGTTGGPNCIQTSHAPLIHFIEFYLQAFSPRPSDRFSMLGGLGHDPVMRDIFVPLSVGASICIPTAATLTNPAVLFHWVKADAITYLHATPQLLRLMCAGAQAEYAPALAYIFSGGDALRRPLVRDILSVAPSAQVVNFFGSTETPQAVAFHRVSDHDGEGIPIGKGIADTQLLVLREDRTLASKGELGEIAVRTHFLSEGYLNNPELTARRFIASPFTEDPTDPLYLTGDFGVFREDGAVEIRGRMDDQVKIRGFRVETREISDAIESLPDVEFCIILARPMPNGENMLVAYVVAARNRKKNAEHLKAALTSKLPPYMVPGKFVWINNVPLLPNGKLDRASLVANVAADGLHEQAEKQESTEFAPEIVDHPLVRAFASIFGVANIDPSQSFDDLGGDSLSFIQASMAVEKSLGKLPDDWETTPLGDLIHVDVVTHARFLSVNTSVIVRAVSIVMIVLSHFSDMALFGNIKSTSALFAMTGWSFATFQLGTILTTGRVKPVLMTALGIAVPTVLYTGFIQLYQHKFYWQTLLLVHNFYGPDLVYYQGYWFLAVLCQIFLLLAALFSIRFIREIAARDQFRFAAVAIFLLLALTVILDQLWTPRFETDRILYHGILLVFLGLSPVLAGTLRQKLLVAATTFAVAVASETGVYPVLAILFVLAIDRVRLPALMVKGINLVAASSLFIYLTHHGFKSIVISRTPLAGDVYASSIVAIIGGVAVWKLWNLVWPRIAARLFNR